MRRLRQSVGPMFIVAGSLHFVRPRLYRAIMPPWVPAPDAMVVASGVAEIAGGVGMMVAPTRRWAGWWLVATLVGVFPANLHMALNADRYPTIPGGRRALWARLPLQAVFIAWVLSAAKDEGVNLEGRPDGARAFSHIRRPSLAEVTPSGRVRLDAIVRWAQDVAWADVEDVGLRHLAIWLVRRNRIHVHHFPRLDSSYELTTYITHVGRSWAMRRTIITEPDQERPLVVTDCLWVHIDPERLVPSRVTEQEIATWSTPVTPNIRARLVHPPPPPDAAASTWIFRAAELDLAGHINNPAFLTPFDDELLGFGEAGDVGLATIDVELEYRNPAPNGPISVLSAGSGRWLVDPVTGEVRMSAVLHDWPA